MAKSLYLVGYDISDPIIQANFRQMVRQMSIDGQLSAYECWLDNQDFSGLIQLCESLASTDACCVIRVYRTYWHNTPRRHPIYTPSPEFLYIG